MNSIYSLNNNFFHGSPARQRAPDPLFPGFVSAFRKTSTFTISAARKSSSMYALQDTERAGIINSCFVTETWNEKGIKLYVKQVPNR